MSKRVSYGEEEDFPGQFNLWTANLKRSLGGVKGQAALRDLRTALLALPEKRLIANHVAKGGEVCAVGAVVALRRQALGQAREAVLKELEGNPAENEEEWEDDEGVTEEIGVAAGIPKLVAWRLVALNDFELDYCTPEQRYEKVLAWTQCRLTDHVEPSGGAA